MVESLTIELNISLNQEVLISLWVDFIFIALKWWYMHALSQDEELPSRTTHGNIDKQQMNFFNERPCLVKILTNRKLFSVFY